MSPATAARILVVDDNPSFGDNLREILGDAGYTVHTAQNFATALRAAQEGFDVALVDLRLPDGDGADLAGKLMEQSPDSEVVMLTGFATVESAAAAVRAGACAYLVKPCATPELLLTLEQALRKVRLQHDKRELARRAQVAEKLAAVGTLTAGLSHEIRNPLNSAGLQLSVLERRVMRLPDELRGKLMEPLTLVRDEIRRLDHILEDFLQFARPRELTRKPVNVEDMLQSLRTLLAGQAESKDLQLLTELEPGLQVAGDEHRLRQAFINLILNAIEATPSGGWVRVRAERVPPRRIRITVEDNGPGIPQEIRERIFEPFFTTKSAGSGLGLPIVHGIFTQHAGDISVSRGEAGGALFTAVLPELQLTDAVLPEVRPTGR
jgi:signal transduction histidine kinase